LGLRLFFLLLRHNGYLTRLLNHDLAREPLVFLTTVLLEVCRFLASRLRQSVGSARDLNSTEMDLFGNNARLFRPNTKTLHRVDKVLACRTDPVQIFPLKFDLDICHKY